MENAHKNVSVTGHTLSICVKPGSTDIGSRGIRVTRDITRRCWEAIQNHLAASGREITNDPPPFTLASAGEYHGKNGNVHYPITPEAIRQMVIPYSRHAFGDEIKVRPHTSPLCRHPAEKKRLFGKGGSEFPETQKTR